MMEKWNDGVVPFGQILNAFGDQALELSFH
jgi:hypothetical protein